MKYLGSKARIAKEILPIILDGHVGQYVEPFCGGCNTISLVKGDRLAIDSNQYLISLWKELQRGWQPPYYVDRNEYNDYNNNKDAHPPHLIGWVGFCCSYSGKFFGGFAGDTKTRMGIRRYQTEAVKNVFKQLHGLQGVKFLHGAYEGLFLSARSTVYCDPPYAGVTGFSGVGTFDHDAFWDWCRSLALSGHKVFVSEYVAPEDFPCVWERKVKSSLSANGKIGGNKNSVERLFKL